MFKAQFSLEPAAKVYAQLNNGTELTITGLRQGAYASHTFGGESKSLTIKPVIDSGCCANRLMVSIAGAPLGFLDRGSTKMVKSMSSQKRSSLTASLLSSASTTALVQVDLNSLVYPWQLQKRRLDPRSLNINDDREQIRAQLRQQYDYYAKAAGTGDSSLTSGEGLDREVAHLAMADGHSRWQVAAIISTSPTLTRDRPDTSSSDWSRYEEKAKEYVKRICDGVGERGGELSR